MSHPKPPFHTLRDRSGLANVIHMVDRKKLPDTRGLAPTRKSMSLGFFLGYVFGFASCAIVLAFGLTFL